MSSSVARGGREFSVLADAFGDWSRLEEREYSSYSNLSSASMSNYSVYFLSNDEGINMNCSVYSLPSGSIHYQDYFSGNWSGNITSGLLPAYYVTNCSMSELQSEIADLQYNDTDVERWLDEYEANPYNHSDNGDAFVALLFMISGSCVSCWMLILLFLLSPKHKKKPLMTQIATCVYAIVTTILLDSVTSAVRKEYEKDSLDMIHVLTLVNDKKKYPVALVISQFLTCIAFFQLVVKMTKQHWKFYNGAVGACLIIMYVVVDSVDLAMSSDYIDRISQGGTEFRDVFKVVLKLLFMIWISITLGYHTLKGTASSPRQVSYSRRLLPLALFTWFLLGLHIVITILIASLWENSWLVTSWITFLPYLLEMYILTTSWEWFYSIRDLESRLELIGMLGRKISLDDVMTFSNNHFSKPASILTNIKTFWNTIRGGKVLVDESQKDVPGSTQSESSATAVNPSPPITSNTTRDYEVDLGEATVGEAAHTVHFPERSDEVGLISGSQRRNAPGARSRVSSNNLESVQSDNGDYNDDSDDGEGYEVQYVDDFDEWDNRQGGSGNIDPHTNPSTSQPQEGQSRANPDVQNDILGTPYDDNEHNDTGDDVSLPPFRPLPGFNRDDYWDDK